MTRRPNPDLIGMTDDEKKAYTARNYRAKNREHNRAYMRDYIRKYTHSPAKVLPRVQRDIQILQARMSVINDRYNSKLEPLVTKLDELIQKQAALLVELGQAQPVQLSLLDETV